MPNQATLAQAVRIGILERGKWEGSHMFLRSSACDYIISMGPQGVAEVFSQLEGCSGPHVSAGLHLLAEVICFGQSQEGRTSASLTPLHPDEGNLRTYYRWTQADGKVVDVPAFVPFCASHKQECDEAIAQWKDFAAAQGLYDLRTDTGEPENNRQ